MRNIFFSERRIKFALKKQKWESPVVSKMGNKTNAVLFSPLEYTLFVLEKKSYPMYLSE